MKAYRWRRGTAVPILNLLFIIGVYTALINVISQCGILIHKTFIVPLNVHPFALLEFL